MLVMRRRKGESILIGEDVEICIIAIGRTKVKLGINAPKSISVTPREVRLVEKENTAAALSSPGDLQCIARILSRIPEKAPERAEETE